MPAESLTTAPLGGHALVFGSIAAFGSALFELMGSPVFARNLTGLVSLMALLLSLWQSIWRRRDQNLKERLVAMEHRLADAVVLGKTDRATIERLKRDDEIGKSERDSLRFEVAQLSAEVLRNRGIVAYSGRRIPLRPTVPPSSLDVLIVEDDPPTQQALAKVLSHYGYRITICGQAAEAIDQIRRRERVGPKFDFVVLDLILPDGNGLDVLKAVRANSPDTDVIVTSGSIDETVLLEAQSHAAALLVKPVDLNELLALLGCVDSSVENSHP
jgi:CheY-like chemotaxis protein